MITVAAIRMEQFGVQFYQASLTARDVSKLVRFEVLSYGEKTQPLRGSAGKGTSKVNWDLLERRIAANEKSYQRQIIGKKIEELVNYYEQCREARNLPSIPGAVIIASEEPLRFEPMGDEWQNLGVLKVPEREGILRAIDGQHRLLALHNDIERFGHDVFHVPAVIFDRLPEDHVVQMFVTINAKHTRLNPVAPGVAGRPPALLGSEPRGRARRHPRPDRARGFGAARRHQAARRRARPGRAGAAGAGAQAAVRIGRVRRAEEVGRLPRPVAALLRELLQAGRDAVQHGVERPQVQHQERAGAARLHPRRARRGDSAWTRSTPTGPTSAPSAA